MKTAKRNGHPVAQSASSAREILNFAEAADLLGISEKTLAKVIHHENVPARKVGREWKFSRRALIDWVGSGRAQDFYKADKTS